MANLTELQGILHRVFRDALPVDEAAALMGADPARLSIYHRFVHTHVRHALEANFPVTLASLPAETRASLHSAYFRAHPPATWSFDAAAEAFPAFLEAQASLSAFFADLARLEWALSEAYAADVDLPAPDALDAPLLNPTLSVVESVYPLADFLARHAGAGPTTEGIAWPGAGRESSMVLVFRHPLRHTACFHSATGDLLFALKVTHDALEPVAAARGAGLDEGAALTALRTAVDIGLVLAPVGWYP